MKKLIFLLILSLLLISFSGCFEKNEQTLDMQRINSFGSLTTLKCYYHNVAKSTKPAGAFMEKDRRFWIEYTGIAEIGVDFSQVKIKDTKSTGNKKSEITIAIPDAKLTKTDFDENSLSYIYDKDSWWNKNPITPEDETNAIGAAQKEMRQNVQQDKQLLNKAQEQAKSIIENYVKQFGELHGMTYSVSWEEIKK